MTTQVVYSIVFITFIAVATIAADDWTATDTQVRNGNNLFVVCIGTAPIGAIDIARKEALQSCRNTAISNMQTDLTVKTLTIQTEQEVALHSEVKQHSSYKGLDCNQDKELIKTNKDNETVTVYIRCHFDLNKAKVIALDEPDSKTEGSSLDIVKNIDEVTAIPKFEGEKPKKILEQSDNRLLTLSVVPSPCDEIVVRGRPRVIKCDQNPKSFLIFPEDKELIVRLRGYKPKHILLNKNRKPASFEKEEELNVFLEK